MGNKKNINKVCCRLPHIKMCYAEICSWNHGKCVFQKWFHSLKLRFKIFFFSFRNLCTDIISCSWDLHLRMDIRVSDGQSHDSHSGVAESGVRDDCVLGVGAHLAADLHGLRHMQSVCRTWGLQVGSEVVSPPLFMIASGRVADLSEFWRADTTNGDHDVCIRNFSVFLIIGHVSWKDSQCDSFTLCWWWPHYWCGCTFPLWWRWPGVQGFSFMIAVMSVHT